MSDASEGYATFKFYNPLYAQAFAKANNSSYRITSSSKPPRGKSLMRGRSGGILVTTSLIIGAIIQGILLSSTIGNSRTIRPGAVSEKENKPYSSTYSNSSSSYSTDSSYTERSSYKSSSTKSDIDWDSIRLAASSRSLLSSEIDADKKRATEIEKEIRLINSELDSLRAKIENYKDSINFYEQRINLGRSVDESSYQKVINEHNALVNKHNKILIMRDAKYKAYSELIDTINENVRKYNSNLQ